MTMRALYSNAYSSVKPCESWGVTDIFLVFYVTDDLTGRVSTTQINTIISDIRKQSPNVNIHWWMPWSRDVNGVRNSPENREHVDMALTETRKIIDTCDFDGVTLDDPIVYNQYWSPYTNDAERLESLKHSLTGVISEFVETIHDTKDIPVSGNTPRYDAPNSQTNGLMDVKEVNKCFDYVTVGLSRYYNEPMRNVKQLFKDYFESGNHLRKELVIETLSFIHPNDSTLKSNNELRKELKTILGYNVEGYAVCTYPNLVSRFVFPSHYRCAVSDRREVIDRKKRS